MPIIYTTNLPMIYELQAPDILAAYEAANCGANPNAGNYINRLRTRTVR